MDGTEREKKTSHNSANLIDHRYFNIVDQTLEWISKLSSGHSGSRGFRRDSGHQMIVIDRGKWWVSQRGVTACKIPRTSWPHRLAIQRDPGLGLDVITLLTPAIAFNPRSSSSHIDSTTTRTGNDRRDEKDAIKTAVPDHRFVERLEDDRWNKNFIIFYYRRIIKNWTN